MTALSNPALWSRLPYRMQIPLGLSLAVVLTAALVTLVAAHAGARNARGETVQTLERASQLLAAQSLPLLAADDTWRVFALLRNTAALLPGAADGHARAAVLDGEGRVFASSMPARLGTAAPLLGQTVAGIALPAAGTVPNRLRVDGDDGGVRFIDAVRSEDGQRLGFTYLEIDAPVFAADWRALASSALVGMGLAVLLLMPAGWWLGRRMAAPVAAIARVIEYMGREPLTALPHGLPRLQDPELGRIAEAVQQLIDEMQVRQQAQSRALSAERMATVGRITAAVAHEINNPLGGLLNAVQTLNVHGDTPAARQRALDLLQRGLHQIRATVAALLPQARIEDRPLVADDFNDVVLLAHPAAERHHVQLKTQVALAAPPAVPSAVLRQVMLNMLLNAIKAAGEGGAVTAALQCDESELCFRVSHCGESLGAAQLRELVAAESGDDPRGFGLWVCHEMAQAHSGGFGVEAAPPPGTSLRFQIPNRPGPVAPTAAVSAEEASA